MSQRRERAQAEIRCAGCAAARATKQGREGPCLPLGWKRAPAGETFCGDCWRARYVLRAITIPVASPRLGGTHEELAAAWTAFRDALRAAWRDTTRLANWVVRELAKAEPAIEPGQVKLAKAPRPYLYPGSGKVAPDLPATTRCSLLQSVQRKYGRERWDCLWRSARSLPTYRYPTPVPIHNQSWSASMGAGGEALVSVALGGTRWTLRLRGGHEYARALAAHRALVAGTAVGCELALLERRAHTGDHRPAIEMRAAGGAPCAPSRIYVKLVVWLPRRERGERDGTLVVTTGRDCFLMYSIEGSQEAYRINADHVRRWIAEHRRRLDRTSDDLKHEHRWPKARRDAILARRRAWEDKQHRRLDTFTHEASAAIAGFAERRRIARVVYDDAERRCFASFPWAALHTKLAYKLDERGIAFEPVELKPVELKPVEEADGAARPA